MVFLIRNKNGHRIYFTIETTTLLHNLLFNITFSLSNAIYCASGGTFLYSHVVILAVPYAFPNIAKLPSCLYMSSNVFQIEIRAKQCHARGVRQGLRKKIIDSNRCVLQ